MQNNTPPNALDNVINEQEQQKKFEQVENINTTFFYPIGYFFTHNAFKYFLYDNPPTPHQHIFIHFACVVITYLCLRWFSKNKPYTALIIGLIAFLLFCFWHAFIFAGNINTQAFAKGLTKFIVFKIYVCFYFFKVMGAAKAQQQAKQNNAN
jgi:hypothetical protein